MSVTFSIRDGSAFGNIVFTETQNATTNQYGLFNLTIGSVNSSSFGQILWSSGPKFLEVNINANGTLLPGVTTQLMSVPYALYAEKSGNSGTDSQTLSVSGNQLSISNGNTVNLPQDGDGNPTNEIQTLSVNGNQLSISGSNTVVLPAPPAYVPEIIIFEERYPHGQPPTTPSSVTGLPSGNAFNTRNINTQVFPAPNVSGNVTLGGSGQMTFKPGTYLIEASAPAFYVGRHQLFLMRLDNTIELTGTCEFAKNNNDPGGQGIGADQTRSTIKGILTVSGSDKIFKLNHYIEQNTYTPGGTQIGGAVLGIEHGQTSPNIVWSDIKEIYSTITIQKIQ